MSEDNSTKEALARKEYLKGFSEQCHEFAKEISLLFKGVPVNTEVEEWTEPDSPNFYYLHVNFDIPGVLNLLSMTWDPKKKILDRNVIRLDERFRGQGYGKKITEKNEEMARKLRATRFRLSSIVEPRWHQSLLSEGFAQDQSEEDAVYKDLM